MLLFVLLSLCLCGASGKAHTVEDILQEIEDPQLKDIFESAFHKMKGLTADTEFEQVRRVERASET